MKEFDDLELEQSCQREMQRLEFARIGCRNRCGSLLSEAL
jgi:hypothetical protein